jgi:uncharacterized protein
MTLDEIRHQLGTARGMPRAALAAAVDQAEALESEVLDLVDLACKGVMLTLPQRLVLFYGIHALAAAKRTALYVPLLALIEARPYDLEDLLSDADLEALLISTCGLDEEPPYDLLENPEVSGDVKTPLFLLIAWLVWQGRASREEFIEFLDRFDREELEDPGDSSWFGWQSAIALLGLTQFEERVRAGWRAGRVSDSTPEEREEWIDELHRSARHPDDGRLFADHHAQPIEDVFAPLRWMEVLGLDRPPEDDEAEPDDPARDIRLNGDELDWLEVFLQDEIVPPNTMGLECLDGFLTALAAGPKEVLQEEWWPRIWSDEGSEQPDFEDEAQEPYLRELIGRHLRTIQRRLKAGYRHAPLIGEESPPEFVENWAFGFATAMDVQPGSWHAIADHKQAGLAVASIAMLMPQQSLETTEVELEPLDDDVRRGIVGHLPELIRMSYAFWNGLPVQPLVEPRRSQKIGRNEPCPCGSGRKYKKCCGAN